MCWYIIGGCACCHRFFLPLFFFFFPFIGKPGGRLKGCQAGDFFFMVLLLAVVILPSPAGLTADAGGGSSGAGLSGGPSKLSLSEGRGVWQ